jgi:hypothetical protein
MEITMSTKTPLPGNVPGLPNQTRRLLLAAPLALGLPFAASAAPLFITDRLRADSDRSEQIKYHASELRRLLDMTKPDGTDPVQFALFDN